MSDGLTYLITCGQNTTFKKILEYRWEHAGKPEQEKHHFWLWLNFPLPSSSLCFFLLTIRNGLQGYLRRAAMPTEFVYLNCTGEVCYFKKAFPSFLGLHAHI